MEKAITTVLILGVFLSGCIEKRDAFVITRLNKDTTFQATSNKHYPTTIVLNIKGHVNDTFMLQGHIKIPGGDISQEIRQDCYSLPYSIRYTPYKATQGNLGITYKVY